MRTEETRLFNCNRDELKNEEKKSQQTTDKQFKKV